jgi:hypothetical protein
MEGGGGGAESFSLPFHHTLPPSVLTSNPILRQQEPQHSTSDNKQVKDKAKQRKRSETSNKFEKESTDYPMPTSEEKYWTLNAHFTIYFSLHHNTEASGCPRASLNVQ